MSRSLLALALSIFLGLSMLSGVAGAQSLAVTDVGPPTLIDRAFGQQVPILQPLESSLSLLVWQEGEGSYGNITPPPPIDGRDGDRGGIVATLLDRDGRPILDAFLVNDVTEGDQQGPRVTMDPATGDFAVSWVGERGGDDWQLQVRKFHPNGRPQGPSVELGIAELTRLRTGGGDLAYGADGTLMALWPYDRQLMARGIASDGTLGLEHLVEEDASVGERRRLLARPEGGYLALWSSGLWTFAQPLDAEGRPTGSRQVVDDARLVGAEPIAVALAPEPLAAVLTAPSAFSPPWLNLVELATGRPVASRLLDDVPIGFGLATLPAGPILVQGLDTQREEALFQVFSLDLEPLGPAVRAQAVENLFSENTAVRVGADGSGLFVERGFEGLTARSFSAPLDSDRLLLAEGRFELLASWSDFDGESGPGFARPLSDDTGAFWFFEPENLELTTKVIDGRGFNGNFWLFYGALSNVETILTLRDRVTGASREYSNPLGNFGSFGDIAALPGVE